MSPTTARTPAITVVGTCNIDLISYVPRMPALGETLHGTRFCMGFGGKGANQAVMAAKLGAAVTMISKVGRDTFGENTLKNFQQLGVSTRHVHVTDQAFSGVAPIAVDPEGNNSIVIVTGANDLLTDEEIEAARAEIAASDVLVCQLEVPVAVSLAALRLARQEGVAHDLQSGPSPARAAAGNLRPLRYPLPKRKRNRAAHRYAGFVARGVRGGCARAVAPRGRAR